MIVTQASIGLSKIYTRQLTFNKTIYLTELQVLVFLFFYCKLHYQNPFKNDASKLFKITIVLGIAIKLNETYRHAEGSFGVDGRPDSNPGRPLESVKFYVAMSRCTNWPPELNTNMVIDSCMLNIHKCMIPLCVRTNVLVKMIYHTFVYVEHTWSYDHIFIFALLQSYQISAMLRRWNWSFIDLLKWHFLKQTVD